MAFNIFFYKLRLLSSANFYGTKAPNITVLTVLGVISCTLGDFCKLDVFLLKDCELKLLGKLGTFRFIGLAYPSSCYFLRSALCLEFLGGPFWYSIGRLILVC